MKYLVFIFIIGSLHVVSAGSENSSLILVHTIFRHGDRTPTKEDLYPKDPYINESYYPYGLEQLTNKGKLKEYEIGVALRKRYDQFLGKAYFSKLIDARSSDTNRTKMSLELMLAGLFPPSAELIWNKNLLWQPIPYNYFKAGYDPILNYKSCPNYAKWYKDFTNTPRIQTIFKEHAEIFDYLSKHSGLNVTSYEEIHQIYFAILAETEWGFPLPKWAESIVPYPLENMSLAEFHFRSGTENLKQLTAGAFIKKVLQDTKAKINQEKWVNDTKMFIYSGHEYNLVAILITLDIFKPHIPQYGVYLLIEVHKCGSGYGLKFFYQDYSNAEPTLLQIPGCEKLCPYDKFLKLVEKVLPENSDAICSK